MAQLLIGAHEFPVPEYPELHAHVLAFDAVKVHSALASQPPLLVRQLFIQHTLLCSSDCGSHEHVMLPVGLDTVFTVPPRYPEHTEYSPQSIWHWEATQLLDETDPISLSHENVAGDAGIPESALYARVIGLFPSSFLKLDLSEHVNCTKFSNKLVINANPESEPVAMVVILLFERILLNRSQKKV